MLKIREDVNMKKAPKVLTRMRLSCCWGDNLDEKELNDIVDYIDELEQENKQLKDLIDTILNFSLIKEECPLNFGFENNTNEDKSQSIFYEDQWCENNCNDNYKDCWLKYFKKLQELEQGSDNK